MKTCSTAMAEESHQLAQLQGQVTSLQAEMATWAEIQSTHEALDRLTQMVQLLMNDYPKIPEKQLIQNTEIHSPNRHTLQNSEPNPHNPPHPPPTALAVNPIPFRKVPIPGRALNPRPLDWNSRVSTGKILKLGVAGLSNSLRCIAHQTPNVSPFLLSTWMEKPWCGSRSSRPTMKSRLGRISSELFRSGLAEGYTMTP
jgi:hypothetical protein